jgi:hypothetical protein
MVKRRSSKKSKQSHKISQRKKHTGKKMNTGSTSQPSGYLIFCTEQRARRKAEFEKVSAKEIMKRLGAEWRKLSTQQQDDYKAKAPATAHQDAFDREEIHSQSSQSHKKNSHAQSGTNTKRSRKYKSRSKVAMETTNRKLGSRKATQHDEFDSSPSA